MNDQPPWPGKEEVSEKLRQLLAGTLTRVEMADWARGLLAQHEALGVDDYPPLHEIVERLSAADKRRDDEIYAHSAIDFEDWLCRVPDTPNEEEVAAVLERVIAGELTSEEAAAFAHPFLTCSYHDLEWRPEVGTALGRLYGVGRFPEAEPTEPGLADYERLLRSSPAFPSAEQCLHVFERLIAGGITREDAVAWASPFEFPTSDDRQHVRAMAAVGLLRSANLRFYSGRRASKEECVEWLRDLREETGSVYVDWSEINRKLEAWKQGQPYENPMIPLSPEPGAPLYLYGKQDFHAWCGDTFGPPLRAECAMVLRRLISEEWTPAQAAEWASAWYYTPPFYPLTVDRRIEIVLGLLASAESESAYNWYEQPLRAEYYREWLRVLTGPPTRMELVRVLKEIGSETRPSLQEVARWLAPWASRDNLIQDPKVLQAIQRILRAGTASGGDRVSSSDLIAWLEDLIEVVTPGECTNVLDRLMAGAIDATALEEWVRQRNTDDFHCRSSNAFGPRADQVWSEEIKHLLQLMTFARSLPLNWVENHNRAPAAPLTTADCATRIRRLLQGSPQEFVGEWIAWRQHSPHPADDPHAAKTLVQLNEAIAGKRGSLPIDDEEACLAWLIELEGLPTREDIESKLRKLIAGEDGTGRYELPLLDWIGAQFDQLYCIWSVAACARPWADRPHLIPDLQMRLALKRLAGAFTIHGDERDGNDQRLVVWQSWLEEFTN